ncbi:MAG: DUF669 domain-containing protein [Gemmatimonadaceae bacterium]|nr:DUF669 domain-containing protein [Gemmatimonadaceae bacterium]
MAQFGGEFDATTVEPTTPMDVLPDGDYPVLIEASEWRKTKKGDGAFLELTHVVCDGPMKGRKLWDRLNLQNPNTQAVEIAQRTLSAICHATGVLKVTDSAQLHNIPVLARVVVKQGERGPMNEIKGYKKFDGLVAATPSAKPIAAATPAPAAPGTAPWMKKAG